MLKEVKICPQCHKPFKVNNFDYKQIYCTWDCYQEAKCGRKKPVEKLKWKTKPCTQCGKPVFRPRSNHHHRHTFCNRGCFAKWNSEFRTGLNAPNWKGGRTIRRDKNGKYYILVKMPAHPMAQANGYIREHRLIMTEQLGRLLNADEIVHHKKYGRNLPQDLEICSRSSHAKIHSCKNF